VSEQVGPALIAALAAGTSYRQSLEAVGITSQALSRWRRRDPKFAAKLDAALTAGRDPRLKHGTDSAWRKNCRCPDCRSYHEGTRKPATPQRAVS